MVMDQPKLILMNKFHDNCTLQTKHLVQLPYLPCSTAHSLTLA